MAIVPKTLAILSLCMAKLTSYKYFAKYFANIIIIIYKTDNYINKDPISAKDIYFKMSPKIPCKQTYIVSYIEPCTKSKLGVNTDISNNVPKN